MAIAGMVLGIVACSLWLLQRRRIRRTEAVVNAHAAILQQVIDEMNKRTAEQNERFETHLGRLNDLQSLLDTSVRVNDAHSEQIVTLATRLDDVEPTAERADRHATDQRDIVSKLTADVKALNQALSSKTLDRLLRLDSVLETGKVTVTRTATAPKGTKGGK